MTLVVFSPHLDDGVLSASAQLARPGATLLTVFGGVPAGTVRGSWDRLTGAATSRGRQLDRLQENEQAAAVLGCRTETWDVLESQYRVGPLDREQLVARIRGALDTFDEIWVPAAIGGHGDHVAVRELVFAAAAEPDVRARIRLHADLPYAIALGWPTWVTGVEPDPFLDTDYWLAAELAEAGFPPAELLATVHRLDPRLRSLKESAALAYRSQLPALRLDPRDPVRWNALLDVEVSWTLPG